MDTVDGSPHASSEGSSQEQSASTARKTVSANRYFRPQVEGQAFHLLMDHEPLTYLEHNVSGQPANSIT